MVYLFAKIIESIVYRKSNRYSYKNKRVSNLRIAMQKHHNNIRFRFGSDTGAKFSQFADRYEIEANIG
jgi:hypothetical protein